MDSICKRVVKEAGEDRENLRGNVLQKYLKGSCRASMVSQAVLLRLTWPELYLPTCVDHWLWVSLGREMTFSIRWVSGTEVIHEGPERQRLSLYTTPRLRSPFLKGSL